MRASDTMGEPDDEPQTDIAENWQRTLGASLNEPVRQANAPGHRHQNARLDGNPGAIALGLAAFPEGAAPEPVPASRRQYIPPIGRSQSKLGAALLPLAPVVIWPCPWRPSSPDRGSCSLGACLAYSVNTIAAILNRPRTALGKRPDPKQPRRPGPQILPAI